MTFIKVVLRIAWILFILTGLWMTEEYSSLAGLILGWIPIGIAMFLPKSKKKREEEEIRRLQIEKLKKDI